MADELIPATPHIPLKNVDEEEEISLDISVPELEESINKILNNNDIPVNGDENPSVLLNPNGRKQSGKKSSISSAGSELRSRRRSNTKSTIMQSTMTLFATDPTFEHKKPREEKTDGGCCKALNLCIVKSELNEANAQSSLEEDKKLAKKHLDSLKRLNIFIGSTVLVVTVLIGIIATGIMVFVRSSPENDFFAKLAKYYWFEINFCVLLIRLFAGRIKKYSKRVKIFEQDVFSKRVLVTLNDIGEPVKFPKVLDHTTKKWVQPPSWDNGEFYMRTLNDMAFSDFLGDENMRKNFINSTNVKSQGSFVTVRQDLEGFIRYQSHIISFLSTFSLDGHLSQSLRSGTVVTMEYIWAITFEAPKSNSVNKKFRLLLLKRSVFERMIQTEWQSFVANDKFPFCGLACLGYECEATAHVYWRERWETLRELQFFDLETGLPDYREDDSEVHIRALIGSVYLSEDVGI